MFGVAALLRQQRFFFPPPDIRDIVSSQVYRTDYILDDVFVDFLHILRSDYDRHVPRHFRGRIQWPDAAKVLRLPPSITTL